MAPKRATFYTFGKDDICEDAKKFITDAGVLLTVRNLAENPFTFREVRDLIGHIEIRHFLNTGSLEYSELQIEEKLKEIDEINEVYQIISEHNSLLRRPIIRSERLITIGCDKKKLAEMLQISHTNGQYDDSKGNLKNSKYVTRRDTTKTTSENTENTPKAAITLRSTSGKVETPSVSTTLKSNSDKAETPAVRATK